MGWPGRLTAIQIGQIVYAAALRIAWENRMRLRLADAATPGHGAAAWICNPI